MTYPLAFRRLLGLPVALASSVALTVGAPPAFAASHDACQARGSTTEEASRSARVYSVRSVRDGDAIRRYYACLYSSGRRVRLGTVGNAGVLADRISPVRLAGR